MLTLSPDDPTAYARTVALILAVVLLALPCGALLYGQVLRRRIARATAVGDGERAERLRAAARMTTFRIVWHGLPGLSRVWFAAALALNPVHIVDTWLGVTSLTRMVPVFALVVILPLLAGRIFTADVVRWLETFARAPETAALLPLHRPLAVTALRSVPVLLFAEGFASADAYLRGSEPFSSWSVFWFAFGLFVISLLRHVLPIAPCQVALTQGAVHARAMELASGAGVKLGQIQFRFTGAQRSPNAFANRRNILILTDRLVGTTTRRELDGIIAHELGHMRLRHMRTRDLTSAVGLFFVGTAVFDLILYGADLPAAVRDLAAVGLLLFVYLITFCNLALARHQEWAADRAAVRLTNDPEGLIHALARIGRLSGRPLEWGPWDEMFLTHPSMARRFKAIGKLAGMSDETLRGIVREATTTEIIPPVDDQYPESERVRTIPWRAPKRVVRYMFLFAVAAWVGIPLAIAKAMSLPLFPAPASPATGALRLCAYAGGALVAIVVHRIGRRLIVAVSNRRLERRVRARMIAEGRLPSAGTRTYFVGIAPGGPIRVTGGLTTWDQGLLLADGGVLRFYGERSAFAVPRACVERIEEGASWPFLAPVPRTRILCRRTGDGGASTEEAITIASGDEPLFPWQRGKRSPMLNILRQWRANACTTHDGPLPEASPSQLSWGLPPAGWGVKPSDLRGPRVWPALCAPFCWAALAAGILTGLPAYDIAYVALVPISWLTIEMAVMSRYRD
jgi:Zn-dependent protease with chaperone function